MFLALLCVAIVFSVFAAAFYGRDALIALSIIILILANIVVGKFIYLMGFQASVNIPLIASLFVISNILTEFYGDKTAKETIWLGFFGSFTVMMLGFIVVHIPGNIHPDIDKAIAALFSLLPRIFLSGLVAFLVSFNLNVYLYSLFRKALKGNVLIVCGFLTMTISMIVDAVLFYGLAFGFNSEGYSDLIISNLVIRILVAVGASPVLAIIRWLYNRYPCFPYKRESLIINVN